MDGIKVLKKQQDVAQKKLDGLAQELEQAKAHYLQIKPTATNEVLEELELEINAQLEVYQEEIANTQESDAAEQEKIRDELDADIKAAIDEIARADGYDLIVESDGQSVKEVVYQADALNMTSLTDVVIKRLNNAD